MDQMNDHTGQLDLAEHCKMAAREAAKHSTPIKKQPLAPEDRGIHKTPTDLQEAELKAAGWVPTSVHPRSPGWRSPDGVMYPGPGYAHSVMKQNNKI
jgi:hypothetical protein